MRDLLEFLRSISVVVFFIFLEIIAIICYALSTPYTEAKVLGSLAGSIAAVNSVARNVSGYAAYGEENRQLSARVIELEQRVHYLELQLGDSLLRAQSVVASPESPYNYMAAKVLYNTTNKVHNQMILNRGILDGVRKRQALISLSGEMVGYISSCSDNYSVATSILNTDFRSSGQIEGSPQVGSIYWNGESRYRVQMSELSKYADPKVGAKVVSTGFSQIFPAGVVIGHVASFELDESKVSYTVEIDLAADISAQHNLFVVSAGSGNLITDEFLNLEEPQVK